MADTLDTNHGTDFRTPRSGSSVHRRVIAVLSDVSVDRALVPIAFVGLTIGLMAVGVAIVLTLTASLPSHPVVALLGAMGLLAVVAAGPSVAGASLRGLVDAGEEDE